MGTFCDENQTHIQPRVSPLPSAPRALGPRSPALCLPNLRGVRACVLVLYFGSLVCAAQNAVRWVRTSPGLRWNPYLLWAAAQGPSCGCWHRVRSPASRLCAVSGPALPAMPVSPTQLGPLSPRHAQVSGDSGGVRLWASHAGQQP